MRAARVLPRAEPEEVHESPRRYNPRHCTSYDTADLYPHLLGSSFWHWNVINCPGGCTIYNHIRPGSIVIARLIACNLIFTLTRILFCKCHAILRFLCAVQAQKGFSMCNVPTPTVAEKCHSNFHLPTSNFNTVRWMSAVYTGTSAYHKVPFQLPSSHTIKCHSNFQLPSSHTIKCHSNFHLPTFNFNAARWTSAVYTGSYVCIYRCIYQWIP